MMRKPLFHVLSSTWIYASVDNAFLLLSASLQFYDHEFVVYDDRQQKMEYFSEIVL
jgi:hypothetical protein